MKKNITLLPLGRTVTFLCGVYLIYTQIQQQHFYLLFPILGKCYKFSITKQYTYRFYGGIMLCLYKDIKYPFYSYQITPHFTFSFLEDSILEGILRKCLHAKFLREILKFMEKLSLQSQKTTHQCLS